VETGLPRRKIVWLFAIFYKPLWDKPLWPKWLRGRGKVVVYSPAGEPLGASKVRLSIGCAAVGLCRASSLRCNRRRFVEAWLRPTAVLNLRGLRFRCRECRQAKACAESIASNQPLRSLTIRGCLPGLVGEGLRLRAGPIVRCGARLSDPALAPDRRTPGAVRSGKTFGPSFRRGQRPAPNRVW
jgi:hypothetical protein